jgi:hypothetical protein
MSGHGTMSDMRREVELEWGGRNDVANIAEKAIMRE